CWKRECSAVANTHQALCSWWIRRRRCSQGWSIRSCSATAPGTPPGLVTLTYRYTGSLDRLTRRYSATASVIDRFDCIGEPWLEPAARHRALQQPSLLGGPRGLGRGLDAGPSRAGLRVLQGPDPGRRGLPSLVAPQPARSGQQVAERRRLPASLPAPPPCSGAGATGRAGRRL